MGGKRGLFVTFEGTDGSGKTSVLGIVAEKIRAQFPAAGLMVLREPGGTPIGEKIRGLLLDPLNEMDPLTEAYLFAASRAESFNERSAARAHLGSGRLLIADRFVDSSVVYQGAHGVSERDVRAINAAAIGDLRPDYTFFFMVDPKKAAERIGGRAKDRLDNDSVDYQEGIYSRYESLIKDLSRAARLGRGTVPIRVDASLDLRTVADRA